MEQSWVSKGVTGEFRGEIREENAGERGLREIKPISLPTPQRMDAPTFMTPLQVFLLCSRGFNAAKDIMTQAVL